MPAPPLSAAAQPPAEPATQQPDQAEFRSAAADSDATGIGGNIDSPAVASEVSAAGGTAAASKTAAAAAPDPNLHSAADCEAYLRSLPGGEVALEQAASVTASLNARHDVLHQEELSYLLQAWHSSISTQLHKALALDAEERAGQVADIELAVESCLAAAVRQRVMETLWQQHAAADRLLLATVAGLTDGSGSFLPRSASMANDEQAVRASSAAASAAAGGVEQGGRLQSEVLAMCGVDAPLRHLDLAAPAMKLAQLDTMDCPLEGINCLQYVTDALVAEAHRCREGAGGDGPVSSDDLLPLLIATLIQARLPHLYSCLQYLANFHSSGDWNGAAGFQLATLEAAITFLQQQAPQQASSPQGAPSASGDTDDPANASGPRRGLQRQSTGQRRLLDALDSDAPITFAQTSPSSTPARSRQRVRAGWPPNGCECRSCLPAVTQTSVSALVQLWEAAPGAAAAGAASTAAQTCKPPPPRRRLPDKDKEAMAQRAALQQQPAAAAVPASFVARPVVQLPEPPLQAARAAESPSPKAPKVAQEAGKQPLQPSALFVQMQPLPLQSPAAPAPVTPAACSTPSRRRLRRYQNVTPAVADAAASTPRAATTAAAPASEAPATPKSAAAANPEPSPGSSRSAAPSPAAARQRRAPPVLSPATALAMMPRPPPSPLQPIAPLVMATPPSAKRPAAAATTPSAKQPVAAPTTPAAAGGGVGIALLLSPQPGAMPGSGDATANAAGGSGGRVISAARRCVTPRQAARPRPIPRRQTVSPPRRLDFGLAAPAAAAGSPLTIAPDLASAAVAHGHTYGHTSGHTRGRGDRPGTTGFEDGAFPSPGRAAARMAHFGALQQKWQDPGLTPHAAARLDFGFGCGLPAAATGPSAIGCGFETQIPRPASQPARHSFQPCSKPSQRSVASPILQATLTEEAVAASQAAALHYRSLRSRRRAGGHGRSGHSSGHASGHDNSWQPSARRLRKVLFQDLDQDSPLPRDENAEPRPVGHTRIDQSAPLSSQFSSQKLCGASSGGRAGVPAASYQRSAHVPLLAVQRSLRDKSASQPLAPPALRQMAETGPTVPASGWDAMAEAELLFADERSPETSGARLSEQSGTAGALRMLAPAAEDRALTTASVSSCGSGGPEAHAARCTSASGVQGGLAQALVLNDYF